MVVLIFKKGSEPPLHTRIGGWRNCYAEPVYFSIVFFRRQKRIAFKSSTDHYFHPSIIKFIWFAYLRFRIEKKIYTKDVADVSRAMGVFWKLFCMGWMGINDFPRGSVCLGGLELGGDYDVKLFWDLVSYLRILSSKYFMMQSVFVSSSLASIKQYFPKSKHRAHFLEIKVVIKDDDFIFFFKFQSICSIIFH